METRTNALERGIYGPQAGDRQPRFSKGKGFFGLDSQYRKWRTWKKIDGREDSTLNSKAETLKRMMDQRMILVMAGNDQLRWGGNKEGNFNIKEEKGILLGLELQALVRIWQKLWEKQKLDEDQTLYVAGSPWENPNLGQY